jgi:glycosyltransferase involved in cell wall biosynthesis
MRVMMVAGDPISCDNYGGVEEHTGNLIRYLSNIEQLDLQVFIFPNPYTIRQRRIHYLNRLTGKRLLYPLIGILDVIRLKKIIKRSMPDIVHFQGTSPLFCIAALLIQRKYSVIITMHGILMRETRYRSEGNLILGILSRYIERYTVIKLEHLIVVAPQIKNIINIRKNRTYVVPNGVDLNEIEKVAPAIIEKEHLIMFIGSLVELKGVHILIEALRVAKLSIPDIHLLVAGSGPQEMRLKEMVLASGLNDNVSFLGYLTGEAKFSHIKAAMFLIVPSLWESLPIVVLEGMACSKAIVASNVGGIPYLIENRINGYLVEPGDVQDLAQKIILLLENDEVLVSMGKASLEKVREFTWENIARETFEVYSTIINSSKNAGE